MSVWRGGCAQQKCINNTQSVVSMLQLVGWSVKEKRDTAQTVETLFCQFVLLQLHFMHSPWSVNSQSVETHLLDFCLHLSLQRREKKQPPMSHILFVSLLSRRTGELELSTFTLRYRKLLFESAPLEDMRWNCEQPPDLESSADLTTKSWSTRKNPSWRDKILIKILKNTQFLHSG